MATLPDPTSRLSSDDRAALEQIAAARADAEGSSSLADVYVRMFNNPGVARAVGALGEQLRFHGVLPARTRELAILRFAARRRLGYEWAHHQRPARLAGLDERTVDCLLAHDPGFSGIDADVVEAVDAVVDGRALRDDAQARLVASYGEAGAVELVALCGLYGLIGAIVTSFEIPIEDGLPQGPF